MLQEPLRHGCEHYERHCQIQAACCKRFFPCRRCHDDNPLQICPAQMDRHAVEHVKCLRCDLTQLPSEACLKCGGRFSRYFCPTCRFYDNDTSKQAFHCAGCGLCRVGGRDRFVHCDRCRVCYSTNHFATHKCVEAAMDRNCPVCLEFLHTTTLSLQVPQCGHILHRHCWNELLQSTTKCPICNKSYFRNNTMDRSLDQEIQRMPMPVEYRDHWMHILCNDCQEKSHAPFHIVGHKCVACGSYNTAQIAGPAQGLSPEAAAHNAELQRRFAEANGQPPPAAVAVPAPAATPPVPATATPAAADRAGGMVQMLQAIALNMDAADLANGSGAGNAADDSSSGSFEDDEGTRDDSPLPESSSSPTGVVARGDAMPRSPLSPVHRDHHDDGYTGSFEIEEDSLEARAEAARVEAERAATEAAAAAVAAREARLHAESLASASSSTSHSQAHSEVNDDAAVART